MNNILSHISDEVIEYEIPDKYLQSIKDDNISIYLDHGKNYCSISMRQLYTLFPNNRHIRVKYTCEKCNKISIIDCQSITKKLKQQDNHLYCPKCSYNISMYKYSDNHIPVSKQQKRFYDIVSKYAKLNYQVGSLYIDIALTKLQVGIEYNGSGHDLAVRLKGTNINISQFLHKEWGRRYILRRENWKMIYIIAPKDKIDQYTDEEYTQIFNYAYWLMLTEDTSNMVEIYVEQNKVLTNTKLVHISEILSINEYKKIRNIQIFSIKQTLKYLHISRKTLYTLNKNKLLMMNMSPSGYRFYTRTQLDSYKESIPDTTNYLLTEEAIKYLSISPYKFKALQQLKLIYPYLINSESYYTKKQLNELKNSNALNSCLSAEEAAHFLHIATGTLLTWHTKFKKIAPEIVLNDSNKYYTQKQLIEFIQTHNDIYFTISTISEKTNISIELLQQILEEANIKDDEYIYIDNKQYLFVTRVEQVLLQSKLIYQLDNAAKYVNLSRATLQRYHEINQFIPDYQFNEYRFYSKKQLDELKEKHEYIDSLFTRIQAAEYLNISLATLDRKKQDGSLIPIENNIFYSREQLDQYIQDNNLKCNEEINEYYSVMEISEQFNLTKKQIWNLINTGKLQAELIKTQYFIKKDIIQKYIEEQTVPEGYIRAQDIYILFDLNKTSFRHLRDKYQFSYIEKNNIRLYNKQEIERVMLHKSELISLSQVTDILQVRQTTVKQLVEYDIIKPFISNQFIKSDIISFNDNWDKNFIKIDDNNKKFIKEKTYVKHRFSYVWKKDLFESMKNDLLQIDKKDADECMRQNLFVFQYLSNYYTIKEQYIVLQQKLKKRIFTLIKYHLQKRKNTNNIDILPQNVLTVDEVATQLNVSRSKVV